MFNLLLPLLLAVMPASDECQSACNSDMNDDGVVSSADLTLFLTYYDGVTDEYTYLVDINCDGIESITDYTTLLAYDGRDNSLFDCG